MAGEIGNAVMGTTANENDKMVARKTCLDLHASSARNKSKTFGQKTGSSNEHLSPPNGPIRLYVTEM